MEPNAPLVRQIRDLTALCLSFVNNEGIRQACHTSEKGTRVRAGLENELKEILRFAEKQMQEPTGQKELHDFYKRAIAVFCLQLEFILHDDIREVCEQITNGKAFRDGLERALNDIILRYERDFEPRGTLQ